MPFDLQKQLHATISDEAVLLHERLFEVKRKRMILSSGPKAVIDVIKVSLLKMYDDDDRDHMLYFAYPGDNPKYSISELKNIQAVVLHPFKPPPHCKVSDVTKVYYSSPWLLEDIINDLRLEDKLVAINLEYDHISADIDNLVKIMTNSKKSITDFMDKAKRLSKAIEVWSIPGTTTEGIGR